jgi:hypothetical protein
MYSEKWATESQDHVSLSKYSIWSLLSLAQGAQLKGDSLALLLRAVALKREHAGASKFIYWSFADNPPKPDPLRKYQPHRESQYDPYAFCGFGAPNENYFQDWLKQKCSGTTMDVPAWEQPLLADYADEFLHLSNQLGSLSKESDIAFLPSTGEEKGNYSMAEVLNSLLFFGYDQKFTSLATKILGSAVYKHRESPVDVLLQALEEIGVATKRTNITKVVAKRESTNSKNLTIGRESSE